MEAFSQARDLFFDQLTLEDGLPNPSVLDLLQDDHGFIWMAFPNGKIVRYDGYEPIVYHPIVGHPDSLPPRSFPCLFQDSAGEIWVGLMIGSNPKGVRLFRYDPSVDDFVPFLYDPKQTSYPIQDGITALGEDSQGRLLVGTGGMGLFVIDKSDLSAGKVLHQYRHIPSEDNSLPNNDIRSPILLDKNGNNWISTMEGLCKYIPENEQIKTFRFSADTSPYANYCLSLLLDEPHTLWVGTKGHGLLQFDLEKEAFVRQFLHDPTNSSSIPGNNIFKISQDSRDRLWFTASNISNGNTKLTIWDPLSERFTQVLDRSRLSYFDPFTVINCLISDHSGNIWLGTWQWGVFRFNLDREAFHALSPPESLLKNPNELVINDLYEDDLGIQWIGTNQGLFRRNPQDNDFQRYTFSTAGIDDLENGKVLEVIGGNGSYLWLNIDQVLHRFDPISKLTKNFDHTLFYDSYHFFKQKNGRIWLYLSEKGALCQLVDEVTGRLECYTPGNELKRQYIRSIVEDEAGHIWMGANQGGLIHFDPKTNVFSSHYHQYGVHDIQFDLQGQCWVVTHSSGLKRFDLAGKKIIHLPEAQNSRIGQPESIEMDNNGYLWIYGSSGLLQFDPARQQVLRRFHSDELRLKGEEDLWTVGFTQKSQNGALFLKKTSQLLYFQPDDLQIDSTPPAIAFTAFQVFTQKLKPGPKSPLKLVINRTKKIRLAHDQNDFTISYAALHFKASAQNSYRYRLDKYDKTWQEVGFQRTARYTNLRPGKYNFRVQAANSDGFWTSEEEEARLSISISPPWYANAIAYTVYGLLFLALLYAIYRFLLKRKLAEEKVQQLMEMDQFKSRFYTNITHEFRTPLTLILGAADQITTLSATGIQKNQSLIRKQGLRLLKLINQLLDLSKLESQSLPLQEIQADIIPFITGVAASFESAAVQKNLAFVPQIEVESLTMDFDLEKVQVIISNLLSNAIKFTPSGGEVVFNINKTDTLGVLETPRVSVLIIKIIDTGPGISPEHLPHIFDRFYQVDNSSTREGEGTGIGLALVKELVDLMGGRIEVASTVGRGTEFQVMLPIRRLAPKQSVRLSPFQAESLTNQVSESINTPLFPDQKSIDYPLVLIVEDNPDMSNFICELLEGTYRVQTAENGASGIQSAIELVPDLIISDVMMPKKDGFELCQTLKQDERTSHIPIILLTAKVGQEHRIEGLKYGADAYLAKPFDQKELNVRLEQLIALRKKLQQHFSQLPIKMPEAAAGQARESNFLRKLQQLILENLSDPELDVVKLCKMAGMSRTQLHNKLKALTGRSASRFIRAVRLYQGRQLLLSTSLSITEIAFQVGFKDSNFFTTCFKEAFGKSPRQLRKKR